MRVNATLDAEVERHYLDFLRTVEEYLRPKQDRVTVVELSKRISKPPEIDQDFPSFSHALRDDPMGRFEFSGSDDDLAVQLASSHSSTRKATTPLGPQSTISPPKEQGDNITAMDFDIEPIRSVTSSSFICPITQEEMHDPVIAADGFTYERKAIEQWFSKCKRSPSTNNDMRNTSLVPNRILKQIMEDSNQIDVDGVFGPTIRRSCSCPTPACQRWSSTARNSRYPSGGEEGLWVYEVVKDVALAYTSGDDIESVDAAANSVSPISGWVFVQGQLVSSTSRRCNAAGLDVVKLEHGLGWLCAAHLREIQIAPELRVFQVTCEHQLGKRAVPDHRRVFMRSSAGSAVRQGQVLSSSHAVTGKDGAIHLRIDGGWVPDRKFSKGQPVPLMVELDVKESLVVYKVVNKVGLALREWPCHLSAKVEPITTVERDTLVGSRVRVRGEHNEVYIQVEVNGVKGWLFASRDKEVTMQRLSKRPQVYEESPGECVQVQLGPREGSWILLVDEPGEATQTHQWNDITPGLARQITDCKAKGKRIVKFAMSPDGKGWVCEGERPDGTGGHVWSGGLCDELREAMFAEGVDQYALGTDPEGAECGVAWNAHTALWSAHNVGMQDLKDLHKAHAERVCLLPLGQFWAGCESGREFWRLHNKHLEDEIRAMANVLAVAQCPQTGAWLVLSDECFRCSRGLPADLEKQLAKFYARRKAQRAQQQREAALYDAVVARFAE